MTLRLAAMGFLLLLTPQRWTPEHVGVRVETCLASWGVDIYVALVSSATVILRSSHDVGLLTIWGLTVLPTHTESEMVFSGECNQGSRIYS